MAVDLYTRAAEQNVLPAQFNLGCIYLEGDEEAGVPQSYGEAARWFRQASGLYQAAFNLSLLYQKGLGVPHDPVTSARYVHVSDAIKGEHQRKIGQI